MTVSVLDIRHCPIALASVDYSENCVFSADAI
jgi:hypothetical protein